MGYDSLRSTLADGVGGEVVALPDGSRDRYFEVVDATGDRVETRAAFVDRLAQDQVRSLRLRPVETRDGGQAVNAAVQAEALGADIRLYGHVDGLGKFPFETVSMGAPATVHVLSFREQELMLAVESESIREWTADDLFAAAAADPDDWITDETVLVGNWVGFPGMTDALRTLAGVDLGDGRVVFDPGDITEAAAGPLRELGDALGALAGTVEVVLTANDRELSRFAEVLAVDVGIPGREQGLRAALGVDAVVLHGVDRAVAATGDVAVVENVEAECVTRRTGAGDRFDGALATALAADFSWGECLALGNACATHYIETGETATEADVRDVAARVEE